MPEGDGGTAAIFISAQTGNINDVTVSNNLLYGNASYTIYVEETRGYQITNVSVTDNYVEKGQYGYYDIVGNTPVMSGNVTWWEGVDPTPYPNSTSATGSVSINDVTISEGNSGTKVATFTVTRSGGTAAFDVNFATSNGTATTVADSDYVAASNTLHFGANQNTQTISVTINGDTKVEANETFNVVCQMRPTAPPSATVKVSAPSPTMMAQRLRARSRSTTSRSARATAARRWRPSRSHAAAARRHST